MQLGLPYGKVEANRHQSIRMDRTCEDASGALRTAIVSGVTRGIGQQLVAELRLRSYHVVGLRRPAALARRAQPKPATSSAGSDAIATGHLPDMIVPVELGDMTQVRCAADALRDVVGSSLQLLLNNAAVCPEGWVDFDRAFNVNVRAPAILVTDLASHLADDGMDKKRGPSVVVNVSSGDGELLFFGSSVQSKLKRIRDGRLRELSLRDDTGETRGEGKRQRPNVAVIEKTIDELADLVHAVERDTPTDARWDVIHSAQPAYALSKACLNVITAVAAAALAPAVRVVAVCPGDVQTTMGPDGAVTTAREAAQSILELAHDGALETGKFYRNGSRIPW